MAIVKTPTLTPLLTATVLAASAFSATAFGDATKDTKGIESIVVTASRVPTPEISLTTSVTVLSGDEIQLRGYASLVELLSTQTGITSTSNGGRGQLSSLRIRGEEAYRTSVYVDGIEIADPTSPQVAPRLEQFISSGNIERIEILRGPQGFAYGADAGGVINIISKRGSSGLQGDLKYEVGDNNSERGALQVGAGNQLIDVYAAGSWEDVDGFNVRESDVNPSDDDGNEASNVHIKLGINPTQQIRVEAVARKVDGEVEYDGCFGATPNDCLSETDQTQLRLAAEFTAESMSHKLAVERSEFEREDSRSGALLFGSKGDIERVEYVGDLKLDSMLSLGFGLDTEQETLEQTSGDQSRDQDGAFVEGRLNLNDRVFANIGARYDDNDDFGDHVSYRAGAAWVDQRQDGSQVKLRASYGTGFRAPSLFEAAYNFRDPALVIDSTEGLALNEERSKGFDVGVEWQNSAGASVEFVLYKQEITDEIVYVSFFDTNTFAFFDGYNQVDGKSESKGFELSAEMPLNSWLTLGGNYLLNRSEDRNGDQRLRRPKNSGNLSLKFSPFNGFVEALANTRFVRNSVDTAGDLEDYQVTDLSVTVHLLDTLDVYARVTNLFDQDYQEIGGFNTDDRSVYLGFRAKLSQ